MEEWVGERWHHFISRRALPVGSDHQVDLAELRSTLSTLYRALVAPGCARQLLVASHRVLPLGQRWLARLAVDDQRRALPWQDDEGLHLPAVLNDFPSAALNRAAYRWLVLHAAELSQETETHLNWALRCQRACCRLFTRFPSTHSLYQRLLKVHLAQRPPAATLSEADAALERAVCQALLSPMQAVSLPPGDHPPWPIALWVYPRYRGSRTLAPDSADDPSGTAGAHQSSPRQTREDPEKNAKHGLLMFRLENMFSWSESVDVTRELDDQPDSDAQRVADDLDHLTLTDRGAVNSKVRVDLDLPSAQEDDLPLGQGEWLPEYDWRQACLLPARVSVQPYAPRVMPGVPDLSHLRVLIQRVRNQFQSLRTERQWQRRQLSGDEPDVAAWTDFRAEVAAGNSVEPALYQSQQLCRRDISTLVLADLSMSTDAYINDDRRIIDVIRDGIQVLSAALDGAGDQFALYGFSSLGRQAVRFVTFKTFADHYGPPVIARLASMRPGYYTRMGAAIRCATRRLQAQPQSKRLLLIISDGKPNDRDHYEGRFGLEDTRAAIEEARQQGCLPFCITVDKSAQDYLPFVFGRQGYCLVQNPGQFAYQLTWIYRQLTR